MGRELPRLARGSYSSPMSESAPRRRRVVVPKAFLALAGSWAVWLWGLDWIFPRVWQLYQAALASGWLSHVPLQGSVISDVLFNGREILGALLLLPFLFLTTLSFAVGALARTLARARVRAGFADPFERARGWMAAHPKAERAILATPALLWVGTLTLSVSLYIRHWGFHAFDADFAMSATVAGMRATYTACMAAFWCAAAIPAFGVAATTRVAARSLLAPVVALDERAAGEALDRIAFDAVAVTTETRAAVLAMAALPLVTLGAASHLGDTGTIAALGAYVAVALGGAAAFRRASRIAVGADGVYVTGTSRTRFFAYKDLDAVRADGTDLLLTAAGKVVLRLQLHGKDATQKDAVLARMSAAIEQAHAGASAAEGRVVASARAGDLARAAAGASDYRVPALTRDQLWTLVEGPEHDRETRTAAARALATTGSEGERARLRIAAEHCAEPKVRVELLGIARGATVAERELALDEEEQALAATPPLRLAR